MHAAAGATLGLPFFHLGSLDIGIPIQAFGVIVAAGVLIGAGLLRRYGEWHGVSDDHIRGLTGWITIAGFVGAHLFDVFMYQGDKAWFAFEGWWPSDWPLILKIWDGISSYGGFVGGAFGFAFYVWWKRLPVRLFADIAIVGLLPAFSIGRIGCTVVSDHIGAFIDKASWYAGLAVQYPCDPKEINLGPVQDMINTMRAAGSTAVDRACYAREPGSTIPMWNLGLVEFLYLVPVNLLVLWLAFRPKRRLPAGFVAVLAGVLYAPVRFFLDYLRPESSDPRHMGLTFAQWASLLAFGAAVYAASRVLKGGKPAEVVAPSSGEAQARLKVILQDDDEAPAKASGRRGGEGDGPVDLDTPAPPIVEKPADEGAEVSAEEIEKAADNPGKGKGKGKPGNGNGKDKDKKK